MRQYVACLSKSCKKVEGVIYRLQVAGQKLKCPRTVNAKVILRKKKNCLFSVTQTATLCHISNSNAVVKRHMEISKSVFFTVRCYF